MHVRNDEELLKRLMKVQSKCPNCGATLTFEDAARLGKNHGVSENAIMCYNCKKVFNVNILPDKMEILDELTKYDFSKENEKQEAKQMAGREIKKDVKKEVKSAAPHNDAAPKNTNQSRGTNQQTKIKASSVKKHSLDGLQNNDIIKSLFYKVDAESGLYRLSKTKVLSLLWFIFLFAELTIIFSASYYIEIWDIIVIFILSCILTVPVFLIGWFIARHEDNKVRQSQSLSGQTNYQNQAPANKTCPNCNADVASNSKFCYNCGYNLLN